MKVLMIVVLFFAGAVSVAAQERAFGSARSAVPRDAAGITSARELYASARYDEALTVLDRLLAAPVADASEVKLIEQYRSFCLLALGRTEEAQSAIAAVVTADPFYLPGEDEVAPRVRSMFADVRGRLLPELATTRYALAKQSYDRKMHAEAAQRFKQLLALLEDPQMEGRLGDLRVLAKGFFDLATAAAAPPPEPSPAPEPEPPAAEPAPVVTPAPRIYGSEDKDVIAPVIVRQELPAVPPSIVGMARSQGLLEVVIDQQGRVIGMTLRSGVHPLYDTILLNAVREWKYRPAKLKGVPVQFRKLIQFNVRR